MQPLVSAVIPAYNYARFLPRAIDSVLAQTYPRLECVVVNDGSTDDTAAVLERYGDRIRAITVPNGGLSAARNVGIGRASGSLVAFLDADDSWLPEKISRQIEALDAHPECGAIGCTAALFDGQGRFDRHQYFREAIGGGDGTSGLHAQLRGIATRQLWVGGSGSGALVPRHVFEVSGLFDTKLNAAEDWDMWLRIGARFRIFNVQEPLVNIHRHGTGLFRNAQRMEAAQWKVYESALARWPEVLDQQTRRRMRALILADAGGECMSAGEHAVALRKYAASLAQWPFEPRRWSIAARLAARVIIR